MSINLKLFSHDLKRVFTGYPAKKTQDNDLQCRTIALIVSFSIPVVAIFAVFDYWSGQIWLAATLLVTIVLLILCFWLLTKTKHFVFARNLMIVISLFTFTALLMDGGVGNASIMWSLLFPFFVCVLLGLPVAWYWIMAYAGILAGLLTAHFLHVITLPYTDAFLAYFPAVFIFFSLVAAILQTHFERMHMCYEESIAELRALQENLEHNIKKRTAAVEKSNKKLKAEVKHHQETAKALLDSEVRMYEVQKMETMGTLVGGIAHDFNNMLAGINANLFMMKRNMNEDSDLFRRAVSVEKLVISATDMIRQLLTFARKDRVEFEYFDLSSFLNEAYKLAELAVSKKISMRFENLAEDMPVKANDTQIQQVLMNMVNNARDAVKHISDPKVHIKLEKFSATTSFKSRNPELVGDDYALLTIVDNGEGIPVDKITKIFEPFFTTKKVGKGTGLGLAMSYGAIQSHGGTIEVLSKVGKGTAFKIYLPIYLGDMAKQLETTMGSRESQAGETILLVDDDQALRESQKEALEIMGYHMIEAKHGREAVQIFQEKGNEIDLILMDLTMPVMGGVSAAERIRSISAKAKIIFVTGYDKDSTMNGDGLPAVGECILEKPYTMNKLHQMIQKQLSIL